MKDWREDYVICKHVKKDTPTDSLKHQGFRVCCENCFWKGFMTKELEYISVPDYESQLFIAKIKK